MHCIYQFLNKKIEKNEYLLDPLKMKQIAVSY